MHRFWSTLIVPLFDAIQPKLIVEIGCSEGAHTRSILEYCRRSGAILHSIDPQPIFDVEAWSRDFEPSFVFYRGLSLNAIPMIPASDVVLIDGDHNWYTVINELRLIERQAIRESRPFPVVLLHDVDWPYGRRDLYYHPEAIPDAYRQAYRRKGLRPGSPELLENGGLNDHLCNSVYENTLQNGVLTAIEDFIKESAHRLQYTLVPGLNGLSILLPETLREENEQLDLLLRSVIVSAPVVKHLQKMEVERILLQIADHKGT